MNLFINKYSWKSKDICNAKQNLLIKGLNMFFIFEKYVTFKLLLKIHFLLNNYLKKNCFNLVVVVNFILLNDDVTDEMSCHQTLSLTPHCHIISTSSPSSETTTIAPPPPIVSCCHRRSCHATTI